MTWIACVSVVCGTSLAAWVLWIRIQPRVTRAEFEAMGAALKSVHEKMGKIQQALTARGVFGP